MFILAQLEDSLIFIFFLWILRCNEKNEKGGGRLYILFILFFSESSHLLENLPFLNCDILVERFCYQNFDICRGESTIPTACDHRSLSLSFAFLNSFGKVFPGERESDPDFR